MDDNDVLSRITIPTPCPMDWNLMVGDDRVRYCAACGKHVHNFAAMTSDEAVALIGARGADLCGQLSRRPDGTLITSDCQPEPRTTPRLWQFSIRSLMAIIAGLAAALGFARMFSSPPVVRLRGAIAIRPTASQPVTNPPGAMSGPTDQEPAESDLSDHAHLESPD